jgi:hypothetical protein
MVYIQFTMNQKLWHNNKTLCADFIVQLYLYPTGRCVVEKTSFRPSSLIVEGPKVSEWVKWGLLLFWNILWITIGSSKYNESDSDRKKIDRYESILDSIARLCVFSTIRVTRRGICQTCSFFVLFALQYFLHYNS